MKSVKLYKNFTGVSIMDEITSNVLYNESWTTVSTDQTIKQDTNDTEQEEDDGLSTWQWAMDYR